MKLKVGIFFGGPSREREISFAGGRTVYDNLNQTLFEPIPIFVDSRRNWIHLDWQNIYKGSIRDFFPPVQALAPSEHNFQVYLESLGQLSVDQEVELIKQVGQPISVDEVKELIDLAFLALHGEYGEDGQIQQLLGEAGIPYTGSGVAASRIGMNKAVQKGLMAEKGFASPTVKALKKAEWLTANVHTLYEEAGAAIGFPLVIRPANQGSSIGVSIIDEEDGLEAFERAVNRAFFRELIPLDEWQDRNDYERVEYVRLLADIRDGLGFPLTAQLGGQQEVIHHPEALLDFLNKQMAEAEHLSQVFVLDAHQTEEDVILESFIRGKEFSCIVVRTEDGSAIALPPTEIVKGGEVFDYRSKYMPGLSRKETPIKLPDDQIEMIRRECERLFTQLGFQVYARIDGFFTDDAEIFLNDPNTTSGMLPSSFFFHQAAEIGLNPSQFLTFIIRTSLQERLLEQPEQEQWRGLLQQLDQSVEALQRAAGNRSRIAVILGGYSFERHISVESGRNIFEKLASSSTYEPLPVFLTGDAAQQKLYQLPINLLLKDNADDIRDKIANWQSHPLLEKIRRECAPITEKYASANVVFAPQMITYDQLAERANGVFIALHGRPGEDGQIQMQLEAHGLPYNGSGVKSSSITIDKFRTLQLLARHNLPIAEQLLLSSREFSIDPGGFYRRVENSLGYPHIAKPVDDGCSSAVKVIRDRAQLEAYTQLIFADGSGEELAFRKTLKLRPKEEFPHKQEILFEALHEKGEAVHFLEITGGLLTHYDEQKRVRYELFEPSETLASGEVLSLEEKFLAGEGQNLTPARLASGEYAYEYVLGKVQHTLERAARLLDVEGYCRIDAFVKVFADGTVETSIIEVNSLPGMTPATAIFHQAALAGYQPASFIDEILQFGFERQARKDGRPPLAETAATLQAAETLANEPVKATTATPADITTPAAPLETKAEPQIVNTMDQPSEDESKEQQFGLPFQDKKSEKHPSQAGRRGLLERAKDFLTSSYFLKNFGAMIGFIVLMFFLVNLFLRTYTAHGKTVQVDNYVGLKLEEATRKAGSRGFSVSTDEAPFTLDIPRDEVIDQEPKALSRIKKNRTVYLTVIGPPKKVRLPEFQDFADDFNQYRLKLETLELEYDIKERIFNPDYEANTIEHIFHEGRKYTIDDIRRGVEVEQGSRISFVITKTESDMVRLPSLVCKRYSEAAFLLSTLDLQVGEVIGDVAVLDDAYIWRQTPAFQAGQSILRESAINLYVQDGLPGGCEPEIELIVPDDEPTDEGLDTTAPLDSTGGQ